MTIPVVFIIYNRAEKTSLSFSAIQAYQPQTLYIIGDGPKDADDEIKVNQTRQVVKNIDWECNVTEIFSAVNLGCGDCVVNGLNRVFQECEQAIIIEDDIIAAPGFFEFCSGMLKKYATDNRVMAINGWNGLVEYGSDKYCSFFSKTFKPWGWASWRRAWQKCDFNPKWDSGFVDDRLKKYFKGAFAEKLYSHIYKNKLWRFDPWAFNWALTIYISGCYIITPHQNLTQNIGFDAEGTNYKKFDLRGLVPVGTQKPVSGYLVKDEYDAESSWYDSSISLLNTFCMFEDIRKVFLVYKNENLIREDQSKTGWECQLQPFVEAAQCLDVLKRLEAFIQHPELTRYKQVFEKALGVTC